jgi:hypothetical protein
VTPQKVVEGHKVTDKNTLERAIIAEDCAKATAALNFILKQNKIGSEMVDNLNASIHLRAVLTDLFLYSEVLKPSTAEDLATPSAVQTYDAAN